MRTTKNPIGRDHRLCAVQLDKADDSFVDFRIQSYVADFVEPSFKSGDFASFFENDAHGHFARALVVWPVIGDGCDRVASKTPFGFLLQLVSDPGSLERHGE